MGMHSKGLQLAANLVARQQPRVIDQRAEERHEGLVDTALIQFRQEMLLVNVVNISSRGTMIECDISPRIGESMMVRFEGCTPVNAFVRWVRDGRVGLSFGHEIVLSCV